MGRKRMLYGGIALVAVLGLVLAAAAGYGQMPSIDQQIANRADLTVRIISPPSDSRYPADAAIPLILVAQGGHDIAALEYWVDGNMLQSKPPGEGNSPVYVVQTWRWMPQVERFYRWHKSAEALLRDRQPMARVGLVYSQQTAHYYGGAETREHVAAAINGMYQALVEARIPFEIVHERFLDRAHLDRYKLLILPNTAALSDRQCGQLREFVQSGGSLLATYETSLYDEWGIRRKNFGLADLFGIRYRANDGPMKNSYARIESAGGVRHPVVAGFDGAERIVNSVYRVDVEAVTAPAVVPLTLIPPYPDLPMEQLFPRVARTDIPLVYLREFGKGRVVYFPGDFDRTFWEFLLEDHGRLLKNAALWAANEEQPVTVTGPGLLDVTVWSQQESMTVHIVNLSNPMAMRGYFREFLPVGPLHLEIRLPDGRKAKQVKFLVGSASPDVKEVRGTLVLTVPSVLQHEVVAVDFD